MGTIVTSSIRYACCAAALWGACGPTWCGSGQAAEPVRWQVVKNDAGWRLLRDGRLFYIQGAVAPSRFDVLKECGGNAVRAPASKAILDAAHREGLAVMANLPVRGERNGFDWDDPQQVDQQKRSVLAVVEELKDHPALIFWSVGNELDHIPGGKAYNPQLWRRLNDLAVAIKRIDANHPVLTVVGTGHFERKVQEIAAACNDMDLLGINAYGDLGPVTELARRHWPKPYVIAEWGPTGHWQVPRTKWRAPLEQTSSEKAAVIAERYERVIVGDRTHCLGSFVFYWSEKQETTHTWYGLFCGGLRTESIDVMQHFWSGAWPANRAPAIQRPTIEGFSDPRSVSLQAGKQYRAAVEVVDPDPDPLTIAWDIRPEVEIPAGSYAGSNEKRAQPIAGLIRDPSRRQIEFSAPQKSGAYRLFVTAIDGQGHIAYGNVPFFVAVTALPGSAAAPPGDSSPQAVRAFCFGNSLTGCTNPQWHEALGASAGRKWEAVASLGAGWQLWQHRHELHNSGVPLKRGSQGDLTIDADQIDKAGGRTRRFFKEHWDALVLQPFSIGLSFTAEEMWGVDFGKPTDVGDIASSIDIIDAYLALNPKGTVYIYQDWPAMRPGKIPPDDQLPEWAKKMKTARGQIRTAEFPDRESFDYEQAWAGQQYTPTTDPKRFWLHEGARSRDYHRRLFDALKAHYPQLWQEGRLRAIPTGDVFLAIDQDARQGNVPGITGIKDFYTDVQHIRAGLPRYTAAAIFYACLFRQHPDKLDWKIYNDPVRYGDDPYHDSGELLPITEANARAVNEIIWRVLTKHPWARLATETHEQRPPRPPAVNGTLPACGSSPERVVEMMTAAP